MSEIPPDGLDGQLPLAARRGGATAKASRSNTLQAQLTSSMPTRGRGLSSGSSRQPTTAFSGRGRGARMGSMYHLDDTGGLNTQPQSLNQTESKSSSPLVAESSIPSSPTLDPPNSDVPAAPVVQDRRKITARDHLHPHWYIRCIMYLVAFLHTRHRVTFRAAGVILICVGLIFSLLFGDLVGALAMPRTLKTVFARFEMKDRFVVNPICFQCHVIFESDIQPPTFCPKCDEDVFGAPERDDENDWENTDSDPGETPSSPTSSKRKRKPNMVSPIQLLSSGLQDFFNRPGMVDAVEAWRKRPSADGELKSMQDGEVWKTLKDAQGRSFFFGAHSEEEIRLGVSFSLDWFNRSKSSFAPSTSSGAMSFCVQNLSTSLRYRTENLILSGMTGQKEPTAKQLQPHLKIIVDDLIMLYEDGIVIKTPEYPDGKRVRVALVAIIADHPAMCKLCGFADHSHNEAPCTKCEVSHDDLFTDESLRNEFPARDGEEHRRLCKMYNALSTDEEKDEFFAKHGAQWTEFARLDYFDLVRYTIVDPMHNLLLGVAKTQWFTRWIETGALRGNTPQTFRELNTVHEFLESFESPLWAGRLPLRVGEAAGGSLTADEYKFATIGPWAVVIPLVWERFRSEAEADYEAASARYPASLSEYKKKLKAWETERKKGDKKTRRPREPKLPVPRMQEGEDRNFLRFSAALKILVGSSITVRGIDRAKELLRDYLLGFSELYGKEEMKPNHHWAVHIPAQALDYGPLYGIWAFLTERLNKVLKNLNSNNWGNGLLEVSMMREFHRTAQLDGMLNGILDETSGDNLPIELRWEHQFIQLLFSTGDREALGTIQDAAAHEHSSSRVVLGSIANKSERIEDDAMRLAIANYYNQDGPKVHLTRDSDRARQQGLNTEMLGSFVETYAYALLDGRRVTSTAHSRRGAGSSLIQIHWRHEVYAGEIREIFLHTQPGIPGSKQTPLVFVAWMVASEDTPLDQDDFMWYEFPELAIETWIYKKYAAPTDPDSPPQVIPLADIECQVARGSIKYTKPPLWITTSLDRFAVSLSAYGLGNTTGDDE